jgi:hypothetical protein
VQIEQAREARKQAQKDEEARAAGAATAEERRNRFKSTKSVEGPAWWQSVRVWLANHNILTAQN